MIAFVPAYDEATRANFQAVGRHLPANALVGPLADRAGLLAALNLISGSPLVIWSHGTHDGPLGDMGQLALNAGDVVALAGRPTYVFACHTGTSFGSTAAHAGWTWWGYTGAVSAPGGTTAELQLMGLAFQEVLHFFLTAHTNVTQPQQLAGLQAIADRFEQQLDVLGATADNYLCLLHLWSRLRVWTAHAAAPIAPPNAGPLFID